MTFELGKNVTDFMLLSLPIIGIGFYLCVLKYKSDKSKLNTEPPQ